MKFLTLIAFVAIIACAYAQSTRAVPGDLKARLEAQATALEAEADKEQATLTAEGKTTQAAELKREEDQLKALITRLEAATAETELRRIETEVQALETRLRQLIARDERGDQTGRPTQGTRAPFTRPPTTAAP